MFVKDENKTVLTSRVFKSGTINNHFEIIDGNDVIIEYFDLEGAPVRYEVKDAKGKYTGKFKDFFRIRFQFPDDHKDKNGKPAKYKSPYGSGNFIFIPEKIRELFRSGQKIERLFLQEGEKKAEAPKPAPKPAPPPPAAVRPPGRLRIASRPGNR